MRLLGGDRPVQVLLAGKAHPRDEEGKRLAQALFQLKHAPGFADRSPSSTTTTWRMAARLVRGCDVWVNLPRPPLEASGTSGMKTSMNGGLQLCVLDGWWAEGYDGANGWALSGDIDHDHGAQDAAPRGGALPACSRTRSRPSSTSATQDGIPPPGSAASAPRCARSGRSSAPRACSRTTWSARTGRRARRETHRRSVDSPRAGGARGNREESSARVTADPYSLIARRHGCSCSAGAAGRGRRPRHRPCARSTAPASSLHFFPAADPSRGSGRRPCSSARAGACPARPNENGATPPGAARSASARCGAPATTCSPGTRAGSAARAGRSRSTARRSRDATCQALIDYVAAPARGPARRRRRPARRHGGRLLRRRHPARRRPRSTIASTRSCRTSRGTRCRRASTRTTR